MDYFDRRSPLYFASQRGDTTIMANILSGPRDQLIQMTNSVDNESNTPLHTASFNGHEDAVRLLLNSGANINALNKFGRSPLYMACEQGNIGVMKCLLEKGANHRIPNICGNTPLHKAIISKNVEAVQLLLSFNAEINAVNKNNSQITPFKLAIRHESTAIMDLLKLKGADRNSFDNEGNSSLHFAARYNNLDAVQFLLTDDNCDINALNSNHRTPLSFAAQYGHNEIAKLLLKKGADRTLSDTEGNSPLHYAALTSYNAASVRILLSYETIGLNTNEYVNVVTAYGITPLYIASYQGCIDAIDVLFEYGADHALCNKDGNSPLHTAALHNKEESVKRLLLHGANTDIRNKENCTPLFMASHQGNIDVLTVLLERGADKSICYDKNGDTPLHIAAFNDRIEAVRLLLSSGADINALNARSCGQRQDEKPFSIMQLDKCTPLCLAIQRGNVEIVELLMKEGADYTLRGENGLTPPHYAIINASFEREDFLSKFEQFLHRKVYTLNKKNLQQRESLLDLLVKYKVSLNIQDSNGNTALHFASHFGDTEDMELLLKRNSDPFLINAKGDTSLHTAIKANRFEAVRLLISKMSDDYKNITNSKGDTPMGVAVKRNNYDIIQLLL